MLENQKDFENITVKVNALFRPRFSPVRRKHILYIMHTPPDKTRLGLDDRVIGVLYRATQDGDRVAVYDRGLGGYYVGNLEELGRHPEALFGVEPLDLVGVALVGYRAARGLLESPETPLPPRTFFRRTWTARFALPGDRSAEYDIRLKDGAVSEMRYYDQNAKLRLEVEYEEHAFFDEALFPLQFNVHIPGGGMRIDGKVESVQLNRRLAPDAYAFRPPNGLETEPLERWFQILGLEPRATGE
jgi:hypothetical protein